MTPTETHGAAPPSGEPTPIVLLSNDEILVQRVGVLASRVERRLVVVNEPEAARRIMTSPHYRVHIVDCECSRKLELAGRECNLLVPTDEDEALILLIRPDEVTAPFSPLARATVYPRHELGQLLEDLSLAVPRTPGERDAASAILGETPAIRLVREQVRKVSRFRDVSVLVLGETGTGKELVAAAIHQLTNTAGGELVAINCAAIPEQLIESELFGHEAGAYTGARGVRVGLLEAAGAGTVFLDEIGEMPLPLQAKLLRALETRSFRRVGSNRDIPLRARIVSATNRGSRTQQHKHLRPDLYYRLAGFTISLPPLRHRARDIDRLSLAFLRAFRQRHGMGPVAFSDRALEALHAHHWPGNVRELRSIVEQAAIITRDSIVSAAAVASALESRPVDKHESSVPPRPNGRSRRPSSSPERLLANGQGLRDIERDIIVRAYEENGGNTSRTARQLGIPRSTLRAKLRRYGVR